MSRSRTDSVGSTEYYTTGHSSKPEELHQNNIQPLQLPLPLPVPDAHPIGRHNLHQSPQLPFWMSTAISAILGIPTGDGRLPIIATAFYTVTFATAIGFFMSTLFFEGYSIASVYTKSDIMEGSITILLTGLWCALGIYANGLARRLFSHPKFASMLRLHAKTVLKLNAALVVGAMFFAFLCVNNINSIEIWQDGTCTTVGSSIIVCKLRYVCKVIFSCFSFLWNLLVAVVLISVCRTHTIGLRRFLWELEKDAASCLKLFSGQSTASSDLVDECAWMEEDDWEELYPPRDRAEPENYTPQQRPHSFHVTSSTPEQVQPSQPRSQSMIEQQLPRAEVVVELRRRQDTELADFSALDARDDLPLWRTDRINEETETQTTTEELASDTDHWDGFRPTCEANVVELPATISPLSNQDILVKYYKISSRLRLSSLALQRWMVSMAALTVVWSAVQLVRWLNHHPELLDVLEFILPLLVLPLLASAYAEVNVEGRRTILHILPLEQRLPLLRYLQVAPLQMTVFSFPISYATIATAAVGILLAMVSKILLQELSNL